MKIKILLLGVVLCFLSCNQKEIQDEHLVISIDGTEDFRIQNLISEIMFHPLDVTDDYLISDIDKIIKRSSDYYLMDTGTKSLFLFSDTGIPLSKFHNVGQGPDEYITIEDFDIIENKLFVLCDPSKIIILTDKLEIEEIIPLEKSYNSLVSYNKKLLLYNFRENAVDELNPDNKKTERIWTGDFLQGQVQRSSSPFFKSEDELYFQSLHDIDIYKLENNTFNKFMRLDYKERKETVKFLKEINLVDISVEDRVKYQTPTVISMKIKDNKIIILYSFRFSFKGCIYNCEDNTYVDGKIRNYPGVGAPTFWGENLIGKMPSFEADLDFYLNYDYLKGIPIKFQYEYPDSDNPVITECVTEF